MAVFRRPGKMHCGMQAGGNNGLPMSKLCRRFGNGGLPRSPARAEERVNAGRFPQFQSRRPNRRQSRSGGTAPNGRPCVSPKLSATLRAPFSHREDDGARKCSFGNSKTIRQPTSPKQSRRAPPPPVRFPDVLRASPRPRGDCRFRRRLPAVPFFFHTFTLSHFHAFTPYTFAARLTRKTAAHRKPIFIFSAEALRQRSKPP